jgi:murein DD-endopeptidase MepM/ murein hydrolase activator NlpD
MKQGLVFSFLMLLLAACGRPLFTAAGPASTTATPMSASQPGGGAVVLPPQHRPSGSVPASTPLPTPSPLPTATATPLPTPTPTATALPLVAGGDLRSSRLQAPAAQRGAPCGVVDVLDFPMYPPDAANVTGGQDFGVFRQRYGKYHVGEDWWGASRQATLGLPVYTIGHGRVTYAQPLAWGRDQGVIIIEHRLQNGQTFYSFYGHLDPSAILRRPGECVARGDLIGQIGDPSSTPHLHFEIRTHAPNEPLGGYWSRDPTAAGWQPPSHFIWEQRIASSPGVQWTRSPFAGGRRPIGMLNGDTFLFIEAGALIGVDIVDGSVRWRHSGDNGVTTASLDPQRPVIYVAGRSGPIEALSLLDSRGEVANMPSPAALWQTELQTVLGTPTLIPLPGGGLVVAVRRQLFGIDASGALKWVHRSAGQPLGWVSLPDRLILSTGGGESGLWHVDNRGLHSWTTAVGGYPVMVGENVWLHARDGLYRLDPARQMAELHYTLPPGLPTAGGALALPGGDLLLAHADGRDRRLLAFDGSGALRWERSYGRLLNGPVRLLSAGGDVYLVAGESDGLPGNVSVFALDMANLRLNRLFSGGTRSPRPTDDWAVMAGEWLVVHIGGGHTLALDARHAQLALAAAAAR